MSLDHDIEEARAALRERQNAALSNTYNPDWERIQTIVDAHRAACELERQVHRLHVLIRGITK